MPFEDWSQNYESVILWRTLKHVGAGFYVDVGSENTESGSVTRSLYLRGWRGINIDPVPQYAQMSREMRPNDITFECACGPEPGTMEFFEVIGTGLSSFKKEYAERHLMECGHQYRKIEVPVRRLDNIIDEVNPPVIHFLKIDVEGAERAVLESIDLTRIRPWIILLEATEPNSQKQTHRQWEDLLLKRGYEAAYWDGLNRWYLAKERFDELYPKISVPPNVFDDFRKM